MGQIRLPLLWHGLRGTARHQGPQTGDSGGGTRNIPRPECHPVIFDRIMARKQANRRTMVICVDPRKSPVQGIADIYLNPIPGYDLALLHAMAQVILSQGLHDAEFVAKNCQFKKVVDGKPVSLDIDQYATFLEDWTPFPPKQRNLPVSSCQP